MYRVLTLLLILVSSFSSAFAQDDWEPTGVWPFVNKKFQVATIYSGFFRVQKTQAPCNIHVGKQTLWYSQNDTLMEALQGSILRVEFPDGTTYVPIGDDVFARIVRQDTINGKLGRLLCVRTVNRAELDKRALDHLNMTQNLLQGGMFSSLASSLADVNSGVDIEQQPLPMQNTFYFQLNGELIPATTKQILAHINPQRKQEYRIFTRSAEIISTNESSMLKVWNEFFIKW